MIVAFFRFAPPRFRRFVVRVAAIILGLNIIRNPRGPFRRIAEFDAVNRARVAMRVKDVDRALALLEPVVARPGAGPAAWHLLAQIHYGRGEIGRALAAAHQAIEARPRRPNAYLLFARIAEAAGQPAEASNALAHLKEVTFKNVAEVDSTLVPLARAGLGALARSLIQRAIEERLPGRTEDWAQTANALLDLLEAETQDPNAAETHAARLTNCGPAEIAAVLRWALANRDYDRAMQAVTVLPDRRLPVKALRTAMTRARALGQIRAEHFFGERLIAIGAADQAAKHLVRRAKSEIELIDHGWPSPARSDPAYKPESRSVFYLLHNSLPYASAGYASRTHGLLVGLSKLGWSMHGVTRRGFPYDQWPPTDQRVVPETDIVDGITYRRLLTAERVYPKSPLRDYVSAYGADVERLARQHRPAIIHAASNFWNGLTAVDTARRLGLPVVYEIRGLWEVTRGSRQPEYVGSDLYQLYSRLEADACRLADRAITITSALKDEMVSRGVPEKHIIVLPNGVDTTRFTPLARDRELAQSLGLEGKTVIGYVGSVLDYEGIDLLLEATARLAGSRDDFHVLVVGDGAAFRECLALRDDLGLQGVATFTGRVAHSDVERYYSLIDIAPFPRKPLPVCEMVSPLKPFEAMAMEVVPVVSSCAALTEIVADGKTGLVFEKGDADHLAAVLVKALDDEGLRRSLGRQARAWVTREREWSSLAKTLDDVYIDLLEQALSDGERVA